MFKNATFLSFYFADYQLFSNSETLVDNKLYVLVDSTVYTLDLEGNISLENMKKVFSNLRSIKKIIRTPNNEMVFIGLNNQYEKIN